MLEFGIEIVSSADGSIAALLGASPGGLTAVSIMLDLLKRCFPEKIQLEDNQAKLREMIPSYGRSLAKDPALTKQLREHTSEVLEKVGRCFVETQNFASQLPDGS